MEEKRTEQTRLAVVGIIIEDKAYAAQVNELLHSYANCIVGRLGLPYEKKQVNIISIVVDAPQDMISALAGRLGRLEGVSAQVMYAKQR